MCFGVSSALKFDFPNIFWLNIHDNTFQNSLSGDSGDSNSVYETFP